MKNGGLIMRKLILATAAMGLALTASPALADDQEQAKPEEANVDWYNINMMKWKSGKGDRAHEISTFSRRSTQRLAMMGR